ncbi:MAG: DUF4199 domain-containing protein [Paramuribaculum sp.]|nr:DUF4199 domain-containing protein [Paramuribaculum sp.]
MSEASTYTSPLERGARYGLIMGLYLSAIFALQVLMQSYSQLSLAATIAIFAFPLVLYRQLRVSQVRSGYKLSYGDLFAQGVLTTLGGAVVSCMVALAYIRFVQPTYVDDIFNQMIAAYQEANIPAEDPTLRQLVAMREYGHLPSGSDMCVLMSSMIVMLGTIISFAAAALASRRGRRGGISSTNRSYL